MFSVVIPAQDIRFIRRARFLIRYVLVQEQMIHYNCFSLFKRMFTCIFVHVSLIYFNPIVCVVWKYDPFKIKSLSN